MEHRLTLVPGLVLGLGVASPRVARRVRIPAIVMLLAAGFLAGPAAATVFGILLGNQRLASIEEIRRLKEYITVILVSAVFVLLTADLDPEALRSPDSRAALLLAALPFAVRPATATVLLEPNSLRLLVVRENGEIRLDSPGRPVAPGVGDAVPTFGPPFPAETTAPGGLE